MQKKIINPHTNRAIESRRWRVVKMSYGVVASMFRILSNLPKDVIIKFISMNNGEGCFEIVTESTEFEQVPVGKMPPLHKLLVDTDMEVKRKEKPEESNKIMAAGLGIPVEDFEAMLSGYIFSDYKDNMKYFGTSEYAGQYWDVFNAANSLWQSEKIIQQPGNPVDYTDVTLLRNLY